MGHLISELPGPLYKNEVKYSAFDMEMIYANNTHFHKKSDALGLILKVRAFGTQTLPITVCLQESVHTQMSARWRV